MVHQTNSISQDTRKDDILTLNGKDLAESAMIDNIGREIK